MVRAIGTSNFIPERMDELLAVANTGPMVNQIELHPFYSEQDYLDDLAQKGIVCEAWAQFNEGLRGIFTHPVLEAIGARHGKTAAQAALRRNVQRGAVVIPKSENAAHMRENRDIWDFELTPSEMAAISEMDEGRSEIMDFYAPATGRLLTQWRIHA